MAILELETLQMYTLELSPCSTTCKCECSLVENTITTTIYWPFAHLRLGPCSASLYNVRQWHGRSSSSAVDCVLLSMMSAPGTLMTHLMSWKTHQGITPPSCPQWWLVINWQQASHILIFISSIPHLTRVSVHLVCQEISIINDLPIALVCHIHGLGIRMSAIH